MLQMENYQGDTNYNLVEDSDIVNNLTSVDTNKALSANQGKILNTNLSTLKEQYSDLIAGEVVDTGMKWSNGKPLYRRVIHVQTNTKQVNKNESLSSYGVTNIDDLMIELNKSFVGYGTSYDSIGFQTPISFLGTDDYKCVYVNKTAGNINFRAKAPSATDAYYFDWYVSILFTKTTD